MKFFSPHFVLLYYFVLFVSYSTFISISPQLNSILFRKWIAFAIRGKEKFTNRQFSFL
jgi:hypothetical protein